MDDFQQLLLASETLARQIGRVAAAMKRRGRFAVSDPRTTRNGLDYYGVSEVIKILAVSKSTFWTWRKKGIFPAPDLILSDRGQLQPLWSQKTIEWFMLDRKLNGFPIQRFAFQRRAQARKKPRDHKREEGYRRERYYSDPEFRERLKARKNARRRELRNERKQNDVRT